MPIIIYFYFQDKLACTIFTMHFVGKEWQGVKSRYLNNVQLSVNLNV